MSEELKIFLGQLAAERKFIEDQKQVVADLVAEQEKTDLAQRISEARDLLSEYSDNASKIDGEVRHIALEVYEVEANKAVCAGVKVGEYQTVSIEDKGAAMGWAIAHNMALKLDTNALKKLVKAGASADGVSLGSELRVLISKDLSEYLNGGSK